MLELGFCVSEEGKPSYPWVVKSEKATSGGNVEK